MRKIYSVPLSEVDWGPSLDPPEDLCPTTDWSICPYREECGLDCEQMPEDIRAEREKE